MVSEIARKTKNTAPASLYDETILRNRRHPDNRYRDDAFFGAAAINHCLAVVIRSNTALTTRAALLRLLPASAANSDSRQAVTFATLRLAWRKFSMVSVAAMAMVAQSTEEK